MTEPFTFHDKRRIDPETFEVRESGETPVPDPEGVAVEASADAAEVEADAPAAVDPEASQVAELTALVAERTEDLQRLQAEYQNYKRRVDRDRDLARQAGVEAVVADLMPILDSVAAAKEVGGIDAGFQLVIDELERVSAKYDLVVFGEPGDEFDPAVHDALLQLPHSEPVTVSTVSQVIQPGIRLRERVLRPARVAVAEPE